MSWPPNRCSSTDGLEALAIALLAGRGDAGHHREVGVDHAGAVAVGAGALGVGAEQRRLDAVGLGERLADRLEQAGVGRRVAAPRAPDRRPGRPTTTPSRPETEQSISELLPEPATPVTTTSTPSGMSTSTSCRLCVDAPRISSAPVGVAHRLLEGGPVIEMTAGERVAGPQTVDGALEADAAARRTGAGAEVDDVVGDRRSSRARARRRAPCCPCRAAAAAGRSSAGCRGGEGRRWARRRRR